jgi:hypothetical protein
MGGGREGVGGALASVLNDVAEVVIGYWGFGLLAATSSGFSRVVA